MGDGVPNDTLMVGRMPRKRMPRDACAACAVEVRGLYATGHNALLAFDAAQGGHGDWSRFYREMEELRDAVAKMAPIVGAHFADNKHAGTRRR